MRTFRAIAAFGIAAAGYCLGATAQEARGVTAGELIVEPPTLISLGFEWYVRFLGRIESALKNLPA